MNYLETWIIILCVSLLGSMIPGISFALVLRNTLSASRSTGIWTAAGLALGMSIYTFIVLLGVAVVILHNNFLSNAIRWGGAAYLVYVGIQCLKAKPRNLHAISQNTIQTTLGHKKAFCMGFLTNALNPKVMLFFLALFTQFIHPDMPPVVEWIYGITVVFVEFFWFSLVAIMLTHPLVHQRFQKMSHWIERLSGVVLLGISAHLVITS